MSDALTLTLPGEGEQFNVDYACGDGGAPLQVTYVNVGPNSLALLPIEKEVYLFAGVISGSGVKYASGRYVWWTKGTEAVLRDEMAGEDSEPILSCREAGL